MFEQSTRNNDTLDNITENLIRMQDISDKLLTFKDKFYIAKNQIIDQFSVNTSVERPINALASKLENMKTESPAAQSLLNEHPQFK